MNPSLTFALVLVGTTFIFVNGDWLRNLHHLEKAKRNLPSAVTINNEVKSCGAVYMDHEICGCRHLLCNGQQQCEHTMSPNGPYIYTISCQLQKPWSEIDLEDTSMGGAEQADCACSGRLTSA